MNKIDLEQELHKSWEIDLLSKEKINKHLSKFNNIDKLFSNADEIIKMYFEEQNDFKELEFFKDYLKNLINKYISYYNFNWSFNEKNKLSKEIDFIDETYDKLIYFWEYNPVEARRQRVKNKKINWEKWKIRWYFWKILKS